ncbi:MAG: hypothetical protein JHC38_03980 [Thiotrichales bacterium]|nr:hypothetical protein [Thiotrichales bacterium]
MSWFSIVKTWLKQHDSEFNFPLAATRWHSKRDNNHGKRYGVSLTFLRLHPSISLYLDDRYQCMVIVTHQNYFWDALWSVDILPVKLTNGLWMDGLVADKESAIHYKSLKELLEIEMLQPLQSWINSNLQQKQWVCLFGDPKGTTWATLEDDRHPAQDLVNQKSHDESLQDYLSRQLYRCYPITI